MIDFVFEIQKKGFGTLVPYSRKLLFKTSKVDQELEYEV
jgi:hypothetical protein